MSRTAKALRTTSDALLRDLERLQALELEKRQLEPEDGRLVALSEEVAELAARVLASSRVQERLSKRVEELIRVADPDAPQDPIEATPRDMATILSEWRDAERRAAAAEEGSAEAHAAEAQIDMLREEYREAHRRLDGGSSGADGRSPGR